MISHGCTVTFFVTCVPFCSVVVLVVKILFPIEIRGFSFPATRALCPMPPTCHSDNMPGHSARLLYETVGHFVR